MTDYQEVETRTVKNDEIAASALEDTVDGTLRVNRYNRLLVHNTDTASGVEVRLDKDTARFGIAEANGGTVVVEPDMGINFQSVRLVNLNAAAVVTDDKVTVRVAKAIRITGR